MSDVDAKLSLGGFEFFFALLPRTDVKTTFFWLGDWAPTLHFGAGAGRASRMMSSWQISGMPFSVNFHMASKSAASHFPKAKKIDTHGRLPKRFH